MTHHILSYFSSNFEEITNLYQKCSAYQYHQIKKSLENVQLWKYVLQVSS